MNTASATAFLPAQTIVEVVAGLVESGALSQGARVTAVARIADEATRRGLDPQAPIDGDLLDTLVVDAIPSKLWRF